MSDPERGAYTPPTHDAPLSFDARQPVRGANPAPYALIISLLVLIAIAGVIFIVYRSGARQAGQPPQTVGVPVGAIKAPPPSESQPQDPAAGLQIYRTEPGQPAQPAPGAPRFAPPPEQPQPRTQLPPVVLAPPAPAPAPPAPVAAVPAKAAPMPAPVAVQPAPLPPAKVAPTPPKPPAAAAPAPKPAPPPVVAKPAPKSIDQALAPPKAAAPAVAGAAVVQIGAFSSQALADKGWKDAAAIAPADAAGKGKSVEKIDKDGATLFRTAVTGFAGKAQAAAFCDKLKAAGKSCFVR